MPHNFFDDDNLFKNYIDMRENEKNFTDTIERPAILEMLGTDFTNKVVLDACCGCGKMSKYFADNGAKLVLSVDISKNMIYQAQKENSHPNIKYICDDILKLNENSKGRFDIIYSSASFHFIKDMDTLFAKLNKLLKEDGVLIFSIEHPITTANIDNDTINSKWTLNKDAKPIFYNFRGYFDETYKSGSWFKKDIIVGAYHRTFSTITNLLIKNNFIIEQIEEPKPDPEKTEPVLYDLLMLRPTFLIYKCTKRK